MSGRMGAKPLRVCLLESFRPSTSSSNECLTTREDHESPASPAHIPPLPSLRFGAPVMDP
jgi:hypothetical protein